MQIGHPPVGWVPSFYGLLIYDEAALNSRDSAERIVRTQTRHVGAFPTATIVVGIGEHGGKVVHQLAERWNWIAQDDPDDTTLHHLALLHVRDGATAPQDWEVGERLESELAVLEGDSEQPDDVLNLLVLRTLGLVRIVDGKWLLACPVDLGPVRFDGEEEEVDDVTDEPGRPSALDASAQRLRSERLRGHAAPFNGQIEHDDLLLKSEWHDVVDAMSTYVEDPRPDMERRLPGGLSDATGYLSGSGLFAAHRVFRRRSYTWLFLAQDPLVAAAALTAKVRGNGDLARFVEPLLARVRVGNSPQILLNTLVRQKAWAEGRDPSPWKWLGESDKNGGPCFDVFDRLGFGAGRDAETHAGVRNDVDAAVAQSRAEPFYARREHDPLCPIEPWVLLSLDWATPGWSFGAREQTRQVFRPLPCSPVAFGFFDADTRAEAGVGRSFDRAGWYAHAEARTRELGTLAQQGLIRLWSNLTRMRRLGTSESDSGFDLSGERAATLRQSLEILGEFVMRDLVEAPVPTPADDTSRAAQRKRHKEWTFDVSMPERTDAVRPSMQKLAERMEALGVASDAPKIKRPAILQAFDLDATSFERTDEDLSVGEAELRAWINQQARNVYDELNLGKLPRLPGDMPIYMRVFVVGDLGESMTRACAKPVLRSIHAELRRAVTPIFDGRFDGHTRPLTVIPYFSMPHPADFGGEEAAADMMHQTRRESSAGHVDEGATGELHGDASSVVAPSDAANRRQKLFSNRLRRVRERLIIDAVHDLRRWVELVPPAERLTFEVLISGRVTDRAVMTSDDAVEEMRAFIWMNARNVLADDALLNRLLSNRNSDVLSTVAFRELSFPAERARAWISNRYVRAMMGVFVSESAEGATAVPTDESLGLGHWQLPSASEIVQAKQGGSGDSARALHRTLETNAENCRKLSQTIVQGVDALGYSEQDDAERLLEDVFTERNRHQLIDAKVEEQWKRWVRSAGTFDRDMLDVRRLTTAAGDHARDAVLRSSNALVQDVCIRDGLLSMQAGFEVMQGASRDYLSEAENHREQAEGAVGYYRQPDPLALTDPAWQALRAAVAEKPDYVPMKIGAWTVAFAATCVLNPLLAAWLIRVIASWNFVSMDPLDPPILLLRGLEIMMFFMILQGTLYLRRLWMAKALERIAAAKREVNAAVDVAVMGSESNSLRPFFDARLKHRWALARQGHALYTWNRVAFDVRLAKNLKRSAEVRRLLLQQEVETYGVRVIAKKSGLDHDEPSRLFRTRVGKERAWLVSPHSVDAWYGEITKNQQPEDVRVSLRAYLDQAKPFAQWRENIPFADGSLQAFSREFWSDLVDDAVISKERIFRAEAQRNIVAFVTRHVGSIGYGVNFRGYEGFDEDGIEGNKLQFLVPNSFRHEFESTLRHDSQSYDEASDPARRLSMLEKVKPSFVELRPNAIFLMMSAFGIREASSQNLRRFYSFHEENVLPDAELFPLSSEVSPTTSFGRAPLNQFSHQRLSAIAPAGAARSAWPVVSKTEEGDA